MRFCVFVFIKTVSSHFVVVCIFVLISFTRGSSQSWHIENVPLQNPPSCFHEGKSKHSSGPFWPVLVDVVKHQQGQKQHSKYRSPMRLCPQEPSGEVVDHLSIFSGASIHMHPPPLKCDSLGSPGSLASLSLTLMVV